MILLKLIRFPNLIIVALTQSLLYTKVIIPTFHGTSAAPNLDTFHFSLLILVTVLIAAGGYIINDIFDIATDVINKPDSRIIGKSISVRTAKILYLILFLTGIMISFYLAQHVNNLTLVFIFPAAYLLLFLYSYKLKKTILLGNYVVALFCAFVAGIVLYAEYLSSENMQALELQRKNWLYVVFMSYMLFAFLSTMFREIIKDIEDIRGDIRMKCRTLPIVAGIKTAKILASFFGFSLISVVTAIAILGQTSIIQNMYAFVAITLPTLSALYLLFHAEKKEEYHRVSQLVKFVMLTGLLFLFFL